MALLQAQKMTYTQVQQLRKSRSMAFLSVSASAELGHAIRETMVEGCLDYVAKVTGGELAAEEVRSIASDPAIIQPGFWQRLGLVSALALGAAGLVWALRRE